MLFDFANLPYWLFLGMGVLLFLFVIGAGYGDSDIDADGDADVEPGVNSGSGHDLDWDSLTVLRWLGVGKAPLMLLIAIDLSILGVLGWMLNVLLGNWLGNIPAGFLGGVVLLSSVIVSLFAGSLISRPLGRIFANFSEDASGDRLIGCIGTVSSAEILVDRIGQVDVRDRSRNLVTITARLPNWAIITPRWGEQVLVIDRQPDGYFVIALDSVDRDNWLSQRLDKRS